MEEQEARKLVLSNKPVYAIFANGSRIRLERIGNVYVESKGFKFLKSTVVRYESNSENGGNKEPTGVS